MPRSRRAPAIGRLVPPTPARADFHAHTARSDGLLAPADLATAAAAAGVRTLAITDHDTLAGYRDLVVPAAAPLPAGLDVIAGVEINATARDIAGLPDAELHLVGLGVDPADDAFEALLERQRGARRRRFEAMVKRLREIARPVDAQLEGLDRSADDALGRPTIARALVAGGYVADVAEAFAKVIGHDGPGYVRRQGIGPVDAIAAIRAAGGIPILAHFASAPRHLDVVREMVDAGLAGIEVHHRSFDAPTVAAMRGVATDLGLLASGGTDFHGDEGTYAEAIAETWLPDDVADRLLATLADRSGPARQAPVAEAVR